MIEGRYLAACWLHSQAFHGLTPVNDNEAGVLGVKGESRLPQARARASKLQRVSERSSVSIVPPTRERARVRVRVSEKEREREWI